MRDTDFQFESNGQIWEVTNLQLESNRQALERQGAREQGELVGGKAAERARQLER